MGDQNFYGTVKESDPTGQDATLGKHSTGYYNPAVTQLNEKREFYIRKLIEIQIALDALRNI